MTQFSQALGLLLETGAVSVHESMRWTADRQQQTGVTSTTYTRINVHSETHKWTVLSDGSTQTSQRSPFFSGGCWPSCHKIKLKSVHPWVWAGIRAKCDVLEMSERCGNRRNWNMPAAIDGAGEKQTKNRRVNKPIFPFCCVFFSTLLPRPVRSQSNSASLLLMTCRQLKICILHSRGCQRLFPASPSEAGIFSRCGRTSEERLRPQLPAAERSEVFAAQLRWAKFNISWTIYWSCAFPIFSQFSPAMFWMTHWYFTVFLLLPAMLFYWQLSFQSYFCNPMLFFFLSLLFF